MVKKKLSTIAISAEVREALDKLGKFQDSYNDIILRLLKEKKK